MPDPKVSVLLTSYNRPEFLRNAVISVLTQTLADFELVILDDASSDKGVAGVLAEVWADPRVVIYKPALVPADRWRLCRYAVLANVGLALARGTYVTYLCDDDWYLPRRLEVMAARLDQGDCQVVYSVQQLVNSRGEPTGVRGPYGVLDTGAFKVDHSSVMHTAQAARDAGGWNESPSLWSHADAAFWDRLAAAGHKFHPAGDEPLDVHRFHPGTVTSAGGPY